MQVLTTAGYKNIEDCVIGEQLVAYDINTGAPIVNELLGKEWFSPDLFEDLYSQSEQAKDEEGNLLYEQVVDEEGNITNGEPIMTTPELLKTKEQVFEETYGELKFYTINDTYKVFANQSIWANLKVVHGSMIQVGDVIYDDQDEDIVVSTVEEGTACGWWRLTVSGDHSYIADDLTLHNASRYWSGNMTGSSPNWSYTTGGTNWGSASGTADDASVPTSADDVIFDGAGTNGNTNSTISATITILSLNITTGYTATMTHNARLTIAGNWTFTNSYTIAGTSDIFVNTTSTITSNGKTWPNTLTLGSGTVTISGNLTITGKITLTNSVTVNKTVSETISVNGIDGAQVINGTIKIVLTGGTWTQSALDLDVDINGNVTCSGLFGLGSSGTKALTYISGTVTTTGSTLRIFANSTLNTNGITWNNLTFQNNTQTTTLTSNLTVNGLITVSATTTLNGSSYTATVAGGLTMNNTLSGTAKVILTGGTWSGSAQLWSSLDLQGNVTLSGSLNYAGSAFSDVSGTITTTGSTVTFLSNVTITSNTIAFNSVQFLGVSTTKTLIGNFVVNGLFTNGNGISFYKTTSETATFAGGFLMNQILDGNVDIYLTGGTWSGGFYTSLNIYFNGNVTISGIVKFRGASLSYLSGTITTTGSTIYIGNSCTLNTNGIIWNDVNINDTIKTITLTSNLVIGGTLFIQYGTTINKTTSETITSNGISMYQYLTGSASLYLTGGTWAATWWSGVLYITTYINGNVKVLGDASISGYVFLSGSLTYISGNVTTTGSNLRLGNSTLNTSGITWDNVIFGNGYVTTINLLSDLVLNGTLTVSNGTTVNPTVGETITCGGLNVNQIIGGVPITLKSGTWSGGAYTVSNNVNIDGNVIISGSVYSGSVLNMRSGLLTINGTLVFSGSVLNYVSGKINSINGTLSITGSPTVTGFNKCPLKSVVITAGQTVAMDRFFSGTPSQICQVSSTGANYTIAFQDNFEKIGRNVSVSGCTLSRPMQLLLINNPRFNTNRSTNVGIRYTNQSPNGVGINAPSINDTMTAPAMGLAADPNFVM